MANDSISAELQTQIDRAREIGKKLDETEPRAIKAWYAADTDRIFIELTTGIMMGVPHQLLQGLNGATAKQLAEVEITPSGYGLHWETLDVDLGVPELVAGLFGTKTWMSELGRQGGKSKSPAKSEASRANGKRGGRPAKKVDSTTKDDGSVFRKAAGTEQVTITQPETTLPQDIQARQ